MKEYAPVFKLKTKHRYNLLLKVNSVKLSKVQVSTNNKVTRKKINSGRGMEKRDSIDLSAIDW